jgi:hypothetical protein
LFLDIGRKFLIAITELPTERVLQGFLLWVVGHTQRMV